jgi:hypothetical protein
MSLVSTIVSFQPSAFVPLALGFFGLGTGYLIYGPQELVGYPRRDRRVDITTGIWGIWMPGFLQFVTGVLLLVGLAWFNSFTAKPLYMTAVAFTLGAAAPLRARRRARVEALRRDRFGHAGRTSLAACPG